MTTLAAWGPTLVMLLVVLLAAIIIVRTAAGRSRASYEFSAIGGSSGDSLQAALGSAESVNAYEAGSGGDPSVHLKPIVRITPVSYREGVLEITRHFKEGYVVSVDLGRMSNDQATRLVDFCSGFLLGSSGWLFRAADRVIVLTPTKM